MVGDVEVCGGILGPRIQLLGQLTVRAAVQPWRCQRRARCAHCSAYLALAPRPVLRGAAVRAAVGRAERSARRAALVPEQDPPPRRRTPGAAACVTRGDAIQLDLSDCVVDALEMPRAVDAGIAALGRAAAAAVRCCSTATFSKVSTSTAARCSTAGSPRSAGDFARMQVALLEQLVARPRRRGVAYLEKWLQLAPFDRRVHERLLSALARGGRVREAEEHLAATTRLFETKAWMGARSRWRAASPQRTSAPPLGERADCRRRRRRGAPRLDRGDAVRRRSPSRTRAAARPTGSRTTSSRGWRSCEPVRDRARHRVRAG